MNHGGRNTVIRHAGDFGNIEANLLGTADFNFVLSKSSTLFGKNTLIGRTLVIHANKDDLGQNEDIGSIKFGNSGPRLACGIIQLVSTKHNQGML